MNNKNFKSEFPGILNEVLGSIYDINCLLSHGGFAVVYEVMHKKLGEKRVIKVLDTSKLPENDGTESENIKERFLEEAKTISICKHKNIVKIHDLGGDDSIPYIVMEYVEGKNLEDFINEKEKLTFKEVLDISGSLLPALNDIHSKGFVHRDLKPKNVMIEAGTGRGVIIDFGIAKYSNDSHSKDSTVIIGSPPYMSPERWNRKDVDKKTDIYSYGVILFKMLTGDVPFKGDITQVRKGHLDGIIPEVKDITPNVPMGVQRVIRKAMAREPNDRYEDALELLNAIKRSEKDADGYPPIEVQEQLKDRYIFDGELLGEGQFSKIYSIRHRVRDGEYALKIIDFDFTLQSIKKSGTEDEKHIKKEFEIRKKRFVEKARFFYSLQHHPNIVKIDDAGFIHMEYENMMFEIPYLVLKRIRGIKLKELIEKESPLKLKRILKISLGILSALVEIHKNDYIYWEVIPEKIFIEENPDKAILLSAGLPDDKDIGSATGVSLTKMLIDKRFWDLKDYIPRYEDRKKRRKASDISLFGILLYQMLTGEKYDEGRNLFESFYKQTDQDILEKIKKNRDIAKGVLKELVRILNRSMPKDLRSRYQDVKKIFEDISNVNEKYPKCK